jgi:hypothetical protein
VNPASISNKVVSIQQGEGVNLFLVSSEDFPRRRINVITNNIV